MNKCNKPYCLRQINPYHPEYGYFGEAFVRDRNFLACRLCFMGFGKAYVAGPEPKPKPEHKTLLRRRREEG